MAASGKYSKGLWIHVKIVGNYDSSGSEKWECKYCNHVAGGSATRIKAHLLGLKGQGITSCPHVPKDVYDDVASRHNAKGAQVQPGDAATGPSVTKRSKTTMDVNESQGSYGGYGAASSSGPTVSAVPMSNIPCGREKLPTVNAFKRGSIKAGIQKQAVKEATREITKLFIQCSLSFHITKTMRWKSAMRAVSRIGYEWEDPNYEALRTTELRRERMQVEKDIQPLRATWEKYGCTLLCDGWSDVKRRSIYNVLVSSCKGTMFIKAIDASIAGTVVTGEFIYRHLRECIMDIGPNNIVQVVTDNGSNCVSMGRMLEEEFPCIVWTPCASHSLDLLMEDIGNLPWVNRVLTLAKFIVKFVTKRPKVLAIFRAHSDLELQKPSDTRFAYMFIVLDRLLRVHQGLLRTVVSREWYDMDEWKRADAKYVKFNSSIMGEEDFWKKAESLIKVLQPFYSVLRITDMEGSTLGLLYEFMDKIGESLNKPNVLSEAEILDLKNAWQKRWDWFHRPIHALAHILHPLWRSDDQATNVELEDGWIDYIHRWTGGDIQMVRVLEQERLQFRNGTGKHFGSPTARLRECQVEPVSWWEKYGITAPNLRKIAIRVLSQDCSSGPCERNWSTWALFHTKKRNRLSTTQLERLVYCHCNLRLLEQRGYEIEPRQVNPDKIDIEKVKDIPQIPQEEQDIYALLHEEAMQPLRVTRSRTHSRVRMCPRVESTLAVTAASSGLGEASTSRARSTRISARDTTAPAIDPIDTLLSEDSSDSDWFTASEPSDDDDEDLDLIASDEEA